MFTHIDSHDRPKMVNVSEKSITKRTARAFCKVLLPPEIAIHLFGEEIVTKKGPVFSTAIIAGTMAAKKTHELIPFCHALSLEGCQIEITVVHDSEIHITCSVEIEGKTGVEMEALVGVNIAALTIYDMCKSLSHAIRITDIGLLEKRGGKSDFS